MKAKNLIVLLIVAVILGGVAFWTQRSKEAPPQKIGSLVLPDLALNDITSITVTSPKETSHLTRTNDVWVSQDAFNYPVDFSRMKAAMLKLSKLKIGQIVDCEPRDKAGLKMVPPSDGPDGGTRIEMFDASGNSLASLLIGDTRQRKATDPQSRFGGYPDGQYVSPDDGTTVYLIPDTLYEFNNANDWLNKELVNVPGADIVSVEISGPNRAPLTLTATNGNTELTLAGLSDKEAMDTSKTSGIKSALSYLRFESVADPTLSDKALGFDAPSTFVAKTKTGEIYTVKLGAQAEETPNRYARISVTLAPTAPEPTAATDETLTDEQKQAAEKEKTQKAEARAALEKKVADLNAKLSPWTYAIASYKSDTMCSTRDKVVKTVDTNDDGKKEE